MLLSAAFIFACVTLGRKEKENQENDTKTLRLVDLAGSRGSSRKANFQEHYSGN
jgi:hypothetical protein